MAIIGGIPHFQTNPYIGVYNDIAYWLGIHQPFRMGMQKNDRMGYIYIGWLVVTGTMDFFYDFP